MIGTSLPEYLFIRGSIWALRAITPLSIFYCSFCIADPPVSRAGKALLGYCALEAGFWLLVYLPRKRSLQTAAVHPTPLPREERKELFWKSWSQIPNPEYYLSKWMVGAKPKDVRRDNVKDFYRWAFLNKGDVELKGADLEEEEHELEEYVDGVQTLLGRDIEPGRGGAQALRLTTDNVKMLHRPLFWYSIVGLVDTLTAMYLYYSGFRLYRTPLKYWLSVFPFRICSLFTRRASPAPDLSYWYRPHTSKTRLPILFIHGISMGLFSYAQFLAEINKHDPRSSDDGDIGIIAIEIMPISFRITGPVIGRDEICRQINIILERHGFSKVVLASHSYGSVITTHLLQTPSTAAKIGPMVLIDPVTFLLHLPDVAYNFTARKPRGANEWQLYYFACTDMMVAHTLARHFFWSQNILWKEDIRGHDVTVSLGGRDQIIDAHMVGKYLAGVDLKGENAEWTNREWTGNGLETVWFPTCDHAQVFERKDGRQKLGDVIRRYTESRRDDDELP